MASPFPLLEGPDALLVKRVPGHNKGVRYPPEALRREEVERLIRTAGRQSTYFTTANKKHHAAQNAAMFTLMWRCGLRVGETVGLRRCDIDLEERTLRVLHPKGARLGKKPRMLGIDDIALAALKKWLRQRSRELDEGATLFHTSTTLRPVITQHPQRLIRKIRLYAGLRYRRVHCHMLRHTFSYERILEGRSLSWICSALGHTSLMVTQNYCHHICPAEIIFDMKEMR